METVGSHSLFLFRYKRKKTEKKERTEEKMLQVILQELNRFITWFDQVVWGPPLIILILSTGIYPVSYTHLRFVSGQVPV